MNSEKVIRAALESQKLQQAALQMAIDDGDDYGEHVGLQRHRNAINEGRAEVLAAWEEALDGPIPFIPPLPPRLYGDSARTNQKICSHGKTFDVHCNECQIAGFCGCHDCQDSA